MTGQIDRGRLDDPTFCAKGYRTETDDKTKDMRIVFFGDSGQKNILGYMILSAPEAYDMASSILKDYDRLEGIK